MNKKIRKALQGYLYTGDGEWSVETDYHHENIYLSPPEDDGDLSEIAMFGQAVVQAAKDMRKDLKAELEK